MLFALVVLALQPAAAAVTIEHGSPGCILADNNPVLVARLTPADGVARARVHFRAAGGAHWYYVDMKPDGGRFTGILPRPLKATKRIDYYIHAVDRSFQESRTPEHSPVVAASAADCPTRASIAGMLVVSRVVVGALSGAPAVPAGFSAAGLGTAAGGGAAAGAAGAAAAGGGGLSTGAIVAGALVVAGAGAAVAVKSAGDQGDDDAGGTIEVTPPPTVRVPNGGSVQFTATARDRNGNPIAPQPRFTWSTSCACVRVTDTGLATLSSAFGPGNCSAVLVRDDRGRNGLSHIGLEGGSACPPQ